MIVKLILLLFVASPVLCSNTYYVASNRDTPCPGQPCLTLSQYVQQSDHYFTSNTTFMFLAGDHSLHMDLALEDVINVSLIGDTSLLPKITSKIKCTRSANIKFATVLKITITALAFGSCGKETYNDGAIHLTNAQDVLLSNCIFHDNAFTALSAIHSSLTLNRIVLTNNSESPLRIKSSIIISIHITFSDNSGDWGGAAAIISSFVNFTGTTVFENNSGNYGGSLYLEGATVNFTGINLFRNGYANMAGGALYAESTSIVNFHGNSSFTNNSASYGGGIFASGSTMRFEGDNSFTNNPANYGGGIFARTNTMNFKGDSRFINNSADSGGGIWAYNSIMNFEESSIFNTNPANNGGGIFALSCTMRFEGDNSFTNNPANYGGGILVFDSTMRFEGDNSFINNSVNDIFGGGIGAHNSAMYFEGDSKFINNSADIHGGGIHANNSTISFGGDSNFINNSAHTGGGMFVYNSTMNFEGDTSFTKNSAGIQGGVIYNSSRSQGGGIFTNTGTTEVISLNLNFWPRNGGGIIFFYSTTNFKGDSSFINNSAGTGGGIVVVLSAITFEGDSSFINNSAFSGGGIIIFESPINFEGDSRFINNLADIGGGIILMNTTINFDKNCRFYDNSAGRYGGGITATLSTLNFYRTCSFINNSAIYGGGMALDTSTVYLFQQQGPKVYFTGNHAKRGGAINAFDSIFDLSQYCRTDYFVMEKKCFLQINPFEPSSDTVINVLLLFENNSASEGGDHLYGGAIDYCDNVLAFNNRHSQDLIETLASGLSEDNLSDISSDPIKVCVCDITDHPDCDRNINVTTYPGESFNVNIVAVGQRHGTVAAVIQGIIDMKSTATLKAEENLQSSKKTCTTLTYTVFSNASCERIDLYAEGPCGPGVGQPLSIIVDLQHCPDGFELSPTTRACTCEKRLQTYTNSCDISSQTIFRADHSDFWVGYDNETEGLILHPHCPFDYCTLAYISFTLNNTDLQCNYNRSGLLCGGCQTDLSIVLGTSRCVECSNDFLALFAAFALAGLLLVFFLLICRLTVAVGTISGLIFYANIVAVNQSIFFPQDPTLYTKFLNVFISWLNLDLGIEICFYNGMDAYVKTWLQFVFPMYIWALVGIVIISSRYSQIIARTLGTNPVAVLATLFLLSYTKILRTILTVLSFTNLQYPNDITRTVWLYDGNITYLSGRHIPLFITAIIVVFALFLPYTLLLLLGQCLQARSNWRTLAWVNSPRLKTIMDAYHGPYNDERRY